MELDVYIFTFSILYYVTLKEDIVVERDVLPIMIHTTRIQHSESNHRASKQDAQGSVLIDVQSDQDKVGYAEPGAGTFAMPLIAKAGYIRQATRHYDMRERVIKEKVVVVKRCSNDYFCNTSAIFLE
jgi:hypothetical protein